MLLNYLDPFSLWGGSCHLSLVEVFFVAQNSSFDVFFWGGGDQFSTRPPKLHAILRTWGGSVDGDLSDVFLVKNTPSVTGKLFGAVFRVSSLGEIPIILNHFMVPVDRWNQLKTWALEWCMEWEDSSKHHYPSINIFFFITKIVAVVFVFLVSVISILYVYSFDASLFLGGNNTGIFKTHHDLLCHKAALPRTVTGSLPEAPRRLTGSLRLPRKAGSLHFGPRWFWILRRNRIEKKLPGRWMNDQNLVQMMFGEFLRSLRSSGFR